MDQDTDVLIGKAKHARASKAKEEEFIHCFSLAGIQTHPGKQGLSTCNVYLGIEIPWTRVTPFIFLSLTFLLLSSTSYGVEYPFSHVGSAV